MHMQRADDLFVIHWQKILRLRLLLVYSHPEPQYNVRWYAIRGACEKAASGVVDVNGNNKNLHFERTKLAADLVKHISTLSTGSLVLIATLLDKLPKPLEGRRFLITSIICFVVCLVCSFLLGITALGAFAVVNILR
jgi:hypothetical protein